jgi:hypothetical protein
MAKVDWLYTDGTVSNVMYVGPYGKGSNVYAITFTYRVDGHYYGGEFKDTTGHGYSEGGNIRVGYNPTNPEENDLDKKGSWLPAVYWITIAAAVLIFGIHGCTR